MADDTPDRVPPISPRATDEELLALYAAGRAGVVAVRQALAAWKALIGRVAPKTPIDGQSRDPDNSQSERDSESVVRLLGVIRERDDAIAKVLPAFGSVEDVQKYLRRTAHNVGVDGIGDKIKRAEAEEKLAIPEIENPISEFEPDPREAARRRAVLLGLSEGDRAVYMLHHLLRLEDRRLAEVFELSRGDSERAAMCKRRKRVTLAVAKGMEDDGDDE